MNAPEAVTESDAALLGLAERLTAEAGQGAPRALTRLAGGRNNQVYRLDTDDGPLVLKRYFRDARDSRDRLGAEWSFISHAWARGIRVVPEPLACDRAEQAGLYSFVQGRKLAASELSADACRRCDRFRACRQSSRPARPWRRDRRPASRWPSISARSNAAWRGWRRSTPTCRTSPRRGGLLRRAAAGLGRGEGQDRRGRRGGRACDGPGARCGRKLPVAIRFRFPQCAARRRRQADLPRLRICRPRRSGQAGLAISSASRKCRCRCRCTAISSTAWQQGLGLDAAGVARCRLLLDAYQIKWTCIILNDFLPLGAARRAFADTGAWAERCAAQLAKAEAKLGLICADTP